MSLRHLVVDFQVPGIPQPKGSQKNIGRRGGRAVLISANPALEAWTKIGRTLAGEAMRKRPSSIVGGPVAVEAVFAFPRPMNQLRKQMVGDNGEYSLLTKVENGLFPFAHLVAPDCDKCLRSVCDLLSEIVIEDDSQVARCEGVKLYAEGPGEVGTRIRVFIEGPELSGREKFLRSGRLSQEDAKKVAQRFIRRRDNA